MKSKLLTLIPLSLLIFAGCAANKPITPKPVAVEAEVVEQPVIAVEEEQPTEVITIKAKPPTPARTTTVLFDFDSSLLKQEDHEIIGRHGEFLADNPDYKVRIEGHTDERGSLAYNKILGIKRANAIKSVLIGQGVRSNQVSITSYGEEKPKLNESSEHAWEINRRALFIYTNQVTETQDNGSSLLADSEN